MVSVSESTDKKQYWSGVGGAGKKNQLGNCSWVLAIQRFTVSLLPAFEIFRKSKTLQQKWIPISGMKKWLINIDLTDVKITKSLAQQSWLPDQIYIFLENENLYKSWQKTK